MQQWICRCERCGQMLRIDLDISNKFRCNKCGNIIEYIDFKDIEDENKDIIKQD